MKHERFFYHLRRAEDGKDLGQVMPVSVIPSENGPYEQGSVLELTEGVLEKSANQDICTIRIVKLLRCFAKPQEYVAYIERVDFSVPNQEWQPDWGGLDGYLNLEEYQVR